MPFAEIIISLALPKNYTWEIPAHLQLAAAVGKRVEVNLGKQKKYAGIIKRLLDTAPPGVSTKEILNVLDEDPVIQPWQLGLWEWMASYYMCTEGEVMAAALPAHYKLSSETTLILNEEFGDDFSMLDHNEYLVAEALLMKHELRLTEVQRILSSTHVYPVVNKLIGKKVCFVWEALKDGYTPKKETYLLLAPKYHHESELELLINAWSRAPKQLELLLAFLHFWRTEGAVSKSALLKKSEGSDAVLKALIEKGVLTTERRSVDRLPGGGKEMNFDFELSAAQTTALAEVEASLAQKSVCLLQGLTSSGKTLIYIRLIEKAIRDGRQVLYMLPEIALTTQIIRRLQKFFGGHIGIYHSRFNQQERIEIWNKVKSGELKVILGARSALFLPFHNISLVIVDEEHDPSYKQAEPAPRYHGRDTAVYLASLTGAKVMMGTATPSLESYSAAEGGKYGLVNLNERYKNFALPTIEIIDIRSAPRQPGEKLMFTAQLLEAIKQNSEGKRQTILFQNRRGYSPHLICGVCGWVAGCRQCNVSLTYHKFSNKLACHYCGTIYPLINHCQACGSDKIMQRNYGTEKVEESLEASLPGVKALRLDVDTVRHKGAHDRILQQFEAGTADVLVGTQMVVKGLDFAGVSLIGIIDADALLHFAHFRVHERAFQMLEQVCGRAGRVDGKGTMMIQTATPTHPLLLHVANHDWAAMYCEEMEKRKQFFYPPFSRIIHLSIRHKEKEVVAAAAAFMAERLRPAYDSYVTGPAEPVVNRVRNLYLQELLIKLPREAAYLQRCKQDILKYVGALHGEGAFKKVTVVCDVDPN